MFDRRSYLDTISALRADPDKLEEIIKMKENDRRHIPHSLRPVAAVAAALALLGISVGAVNTEPVQEFLYHISPRRSGGRVPPGHHHRGGGGPHHLPHA